MKTSAIVAFSVFLASCSYEFSHPPFQKDELTEITKSEFGKELLSHIENFPDIEQAGNSEETLTEATWVYVVADDFLIQQKEKDESPGWELTIWTKNRHHIISCSLMQDENVAIDNVDAQEKEDGTIYLEGRTEELKHLAIELSLTAPKLCVAFPYMNASDVIDPTTEYKTQIDRLTTELGIATNAMLREQGTAQDLQKLNQKLDDELSASKTRSLLLLVIVIVIAGIGAVAIIIIGVRSRLKRAGRQQ